MGKMKGKTLIIATHALQYISGIENIYLLSNGKIVANGTYAEIKKTDEYLDYVQEQLKELELRKSIAHSRQSIDAHDPIMLEKKISLLKNSNEEIIKDIQSNSKKDSIEESYDLNNDDFQVADEPDININVQASTKMNTSYLYHKNLKSKISNDQVQENEISIQLNKKVQDQPDQENLIQKNDTPNISKERLNSEQVEIKDMENKEKGALTTAETKHEGVIPLKIFKWYFCKAHTSIWIFTFFIHIICCVLVAMQEWWIGIWAKDTYDKSNFWYAMIFLIFITVVVVLTVYRFYLFGIACTETAYIVYIDLVSKILRRPMLFFDTTPIGQILNHCGRDVEVLDVQFPFTIAGFFFGLFGILTSLIIVAIILPIMIVFFIITFAVLTWISLDYIKTSTEIRRLHLISTSPILGTSTEAVNGYSTVRSYAKVDYWFKQHAKNVDTYISTFIHENYAMKWIELYMDVFLNICVTFIMALVLVSLYVELNATKEKGLMGLVLSNAFAISGALPYVLVNISELVKSAASIQRLHTYTENIELEKDLYLPKAPENWPTSGSIELKSLKIRYRENLPLVLHDVSCKIEGREKVGIIGRTGSGKSSMLLALTRILEISDKDLDAGSCVMLDGVKINSIGLHELRKNITVIPQDPFM